MMSQWPVHILPPEKHMSNPVCGSTTTSSTGLAPSVAGAVALKVGA